MITCIRLLVDAVRFRLLPRRVWLAATSIAFLSVCSLCRADTVASLLGNFTINQYADVALESQSVDVHYVIVYGQLPALRELHNADADGNGVTTQAERDAYVGTLAPGFAKAITLTVDGARVPLHASGWTSSLPTEQGGFSLRVDVQLTAALPNASPGAARRVEFSNQNYAGRIGWHEIVVNPVGSLAVYDTDAYGDSATNGLTDALQALPQSGPLDERSVHWRMNDGAPPSGAQVLGKRPRSELPVLKPGAAARGTAAQMPSESEWIVSKTRNLVDAISAPHLDPKVAVWALFAALVLGAVHALSPGHGKTIVGAYLIGSRGTPRHAVFLGLTVTVTHTLGVFLIGFATLYASRFIVPERLFPILSLVSALIVLAMGITLLVQRGRAARGAPPLRRAASYSSFELVAAGDARPGFLLTPHQAIMHGPDGTLHSHGGGPMHSHLPPGARGERVTWKSLLTLGISGGLVPCPSAMVLLLAAIALNKTAYGMLLVVVFSVGLAITLTLVGFAFLYARNRFSQPSSKSRWMAWLPVMSAAAITLVGIALCVGALRSFG